MKACTIKEPWATLIAQGIKDIENRTWKTTFRGRIYIHTAQKPACKKLVEVLDWKQAFEYGYKHKENGFKEIQSTSQLINGAIIGEVDIIDCVINHPSIWAQETEGVANNHDLYPNGAPSYFGFKGCIYNWVLANAVLYDKPILDVKGKLSLWNYDT